MRMKLWYSFRLVPHVVGVSQCDHQRFSVIGRKIPNSRNGLERRVTDNSASLSDKENGMQ